jgi:hypothetical protein
MSKQLIFSNPAGALFSAAPYATSCDRVEAIGMLLIKFAVSNGLESLVMSRSAVLSGQMNSEESNDETHPVGHAGALGN